MDFKNQSRPIIIAEAGTCHASSNRGNRLRNAMAYVLAAHDAGADIVKFQAFTDEPENIFCWVYGDEARMQRWVESALTKDEWKTLKRFADDMGTELLLSCFQHETVEMSRELGLCASKVASRAADTFPYEDAPRPWIVSTGMNPPPSWIIDHKGSILMECESKYPSTMEWSGKYPGFSDHSANPDVAKRAINNGCKLIEVHFYINKEDAGQDEPASLNLRQLKELCDYGHGSGA